MAVISWFQKKFIFIPFLLLFTFMVFLYKTCNKSNDVSHILQTREEISFLKNKLTELEAYQKSKVKERKKDSSNEPTIYFVTPTYTRYTQQADLVRLSNTLKHVPNLHWILIEDSETQTLLVSNFLNTSGLVYTHLHVHTQKRLKLQKNDPRWKRHRGVDQRNLALSWMRKNVDPDSEGVLYFGDDDNTYHVDLFKEMRTTKKVSMWPVALVGGLRFEGPVCEKGKVVKFFTAWMPTRQFPVDMAAFSINIRLLFENPSCYINPEVQRGYLETDFLQQLKLSKDDIEAKADDCSKILVWHTQTAEPKMKEEIKLNQHGQGSNPEIII